MINNVKIKNTILIKEIVIKKRKNFKKYVLTLCLAMEFVIVLVMMKNIFEIMRIAKKPNFAKSRMNWM